MVLEDSWIILDPSLELVGNWPIYAHIVDSLTFIDYVRDQLAPRLPRSPIFYMSSLIPELAMVGMAGPRKSLFNRVPLGLVPGNCERYNSQLQYFTPQPLSWKQSLHCLRGDP